MAELILTEAEKKANTWLELDDDTIGKLTKKLALSLIAEDKERERVWVMSAALVLTGLAYDANADEIVVSLDKMTRGGRVCGDWKITVEKCE